MSELASTSGKLVGIKSLKLWASKSLHRTPRLRSIILSDVDVMGAEEFMVKIEVWSRLLDAETRDGTNRVHDGAYRYYGWAAAPQIGSEGEQYVR